MSEQNGILPQKNWRVLNRDTSRSLVDVLLEQLGLPAEHMAPFRLSDRMHDPLLLPDMEKGVERILQAIERQEKIVIFGDYDVDGVSSTAMMIYLFRELDYPVDFLVPHRERDGYGLRPAGVDRANALGAKLIITVDNGISANEAIDYANSLGIDVLVTDHHLQEGDLPNACAVINPNRADSTYPFKQICGVAVAFKVAHALTRQVLSEERYKRFLLSHLDLVTIGTIADVMPIRDENYAMVKFGLKVLSNTRKPGLIELKKVSGVKTERISAVTVGFFLAPRLNAAGRMEDARLSVELLIAGDSYQAQDKARELDRLNRSRQNLQQSYLDDALHAWENSVGDDKVIIVENEKWQAGLIGLVSGRLKEAYARPAIAFTRDGEGNYVGSARSIDAFHVTEALTRFNHYFLNYGGHHKAAGMTIAPDHYSVFKQEFTEYVNRQLAGQDLRAELVIDSVVDIDQLNENVVRDIENVGPFGEENPEPYLLMENAVIRDIRLLSEGKHIKMVVQKGNRNFECIWWRSGEFKDAIRFGALCDIVFRMNINVFQGRSRLQLTVEDMALKN